MRHRARRTIAVALVVLGASLMVLTPEWIGGYVMLLLGLVIEIVGIALVRKDKG